MKTENSVNTLELIRGVLTLKFKPEKSLNGFCEKHFANFSSGQYEPLAIRIFRMNNENVITLYAVDRNRQHEKYNEKNKQPVKKFKSITADPAFLLDYIAELNVTLSTGLHSIDEIEVLNK